jgi:hemolysin activation/secretion protein
VTAFRHNKYNFDERPDVAPNLNKIYWNRTATLVSLGYSNRNYKRDVLIYGFGRTEDVPIGNLFVLTVGRENTEFGARGYAGVQYATGKYLPHNLGYFYARANLGTYSKNGRAQQGVINGEVNYISNLIPFRYSFFRQFLTFRYTHGIRRDPLDYLNISNNQGIRGINNDQLIGTKKFTVGAETVFFSDKSLLGFRIAYFVFGDIGLVNGVPSIWKSPLYQGYGLGLRLRNESLTFNTLQLRFGYYLNSPDLTSPTRFNASGNVPLRLRDFDISAPAIAPFQ